MIWCPYCGDVPDLPKDGEIWVDPPCGFPRGPVTQEMIDERPEFYRAVKILLDTGTGQIQMMDASGDTETYWYQ